MRLENKKFSRMRIYCYKNMSNSHICPCFLVSSKTLISALNGLINMNSEAHGNVCPNLWFLENNISLVYSIKPFASTSKSDRIVFKVPTLNPFSTKPAKTGHFYSILLCLKPDDFTCQAEKLWCERFNWVYLANLSTLTLSLTHRLNPATLLFYSV